jgi:hypothetical protein
MSYQLTKEIKQQIACCTKDLRDAVTLIETSLDPTNENEFVLTRPNGEPFETNVDGQAIVGMSDVPKVNDEYLTGEMYNGLPVYASQIEVNLNGASPANPSLFVFDTLISADLIFVTSAGAQYHLGSPSAALVAICDAYAFITNAGALTVEWSTVHAAGNKLRMFLRYTRV